MNPQMLETLSKSTLIFLVLSFVKIDRALLMAAASKELAVRKADVDLWRVIDIHKRNNPQAGRPDLELQRAERALEEWRTSNFIDTALAQLPSEPTPSKFEIRRPYGYEIKVALAAAELVRFGAAPSDSTTLLRTGTEESVRAWAMSQSREINGRTLQVVGVERLIPLDQAEYRLKLKDKRGW